MPSDKNGPAAAERLPFDQIYRKMLGHRATVRDLLRNHLAQPRGPLPAELVRALDMRTVRRLPTDWVTKDLRDRRGDAAFAIDFKKGMRRAGWPERLFLHIEHQSTPDGRMLFRFFEYGHEFSRELAASGELGRTATARSCAFWYTAARTAGRCRRGRRRSARCRRRWAASRRCRKSWRRSFRAATVWLPWRGSGVYCLRTNVADWDEVALAHLHRPGAPTPP